MVRAGFRTNTQTNRTVDASQTLDSVAIDFSDPQLPFKKAVQLYMTMFEVSAEQAKDQVRLERGGAKRLQIIDGRLSELV